MVGELSKEKLWTAANVVTLLRICGVPIFVVALISPWPTWFPSWFSAQDWKEWVAAGIFIILAATDGLDGYLARSRNEVTNFGKFMDPLADKILVAAALLALIELGTLPSWVALMILAREFIVSGIRMVAASQGTVISASWYGKAKTVAQIIAIVLFIVKDSHMVSDFSAVLSDQLYLFSWAVMIIALALTLVSMLDYFAKARRALHFGSNKLQDEQFSIQDLAAEVITKARQKQIKLGTAESCTGGLVSSNLTNIPGSSEIFMGAIVSYSNQVKKERLSVSDTILKNFGAVSRQTAEAMCLGALSALNANVAVSITGVAGPSGGSVEKPVGTVWIAVVMQGGKPQANCYLIEGDREEVRSQTVKYALLSLVSVLDEISPSNATKDSHDEELS